MFRSNPPSVISPGLGAGVAAAVLPPCTSDVSMAILLVSSPGAGAETGTAGAGAAAPGLIKADRLASTLAVFCEVSAGGAAGAAGAGRAYDALDAAGGVPGGVFPLVCARSAATLAGSAEPEAGAAAGAAAAAGGTLLAGGGSDGVVLLP